MKTKDFVRQESNPGAILNVDNSGLQAYRRQREIMRNNANNAERISKLESDMSDIKDKLDLILQKLS